MDHDQRFKTLLRKFLPEFLQLFLPRFAGRFDLSQVQWVEQEVFPDPPQGERRYVDLLAWLKTTEPVPDPGEDPAEHWLALIHVEIEHRDSVAPLRRRMFDYYQHLHRRHGIPVLPVALYLNVGLDGLGWDTYERHFWDERIVQFRYPYVGLPALDAQAYLNQENWLGVALTALMHTPPEQRLEIAYQAWCRLLQCPENVHRRFLLCECLDAYAPEDQAQRSLLDTRLLNIPEPGARQTMESLLERIRKQAEQEGRQEGLRQTLLTLLETRFGELPAATRQKVENATPEQLQQWLTDFARSKTLEEMGLRDG